MMDTHPKKLILTIMATECSNRCRHCWAQGHPPLSPMKLGDIKLVAKQISDAAYTAGFNRVLVMLMNDIWCHSDALDLWRFQRDFNKGVVDKAILTNGQVLAHHPRIGELIDTIKAEGIVNARLTIHGLQSMHDWFVQREGAYADIVEAAKRLVEYGIAVEWNVYLNKQNILHLPELIDALRHLTRDHDPLLNLTVPAWVPNRRLVDYEPLRLEISDLENARRLLAGQIQMPAFLDEGQVTRAVLADAYDLTEMNRDYQTYRRLGSIVAVTCDYSLNIYEGPPGNYEYYHGNLNSDGLSKVMDSITRYQPASLPSISQLCQHYGDKTCTKVHSTDVSILRKWLAEYWIQQSIDVPSPAGVEPTLHALA